MLQDWQLNTILQEISMKKKPTDQLCPKSQKISKKYNPVKENPNIKIIIWGMVPINAVIEYKNSEKIVIDFT